MAGSVLTPESRTPLRERLATTEPAHHGIGDAAQWDAQTTRGRFRILVVPATRELVVHDTGAAMGKSERGRFTWRELALAVARAEQCSREADARGEPNSIPGKGFRHDWTHPKTWERT